MITMPGCTDSLCKECFKGMFEVVINEQGVKHFNCPICHKPDMANKDDIQEMYEVLFVNMVSSRAVECISTALLLCNTADTRESKALEISVQQYHDNYNNAQQTYVYSVNTFTAIVE
jgi:hypothetical protein